MCGRFTLSRPAEQVAEFLQLEDVPDIEPRFNIAPTQPVLAVRAKASGKREPCVLRWGLVPSWAKDLSGGARMINARAETVLEKPSYRAAFQHHRCLIPADGFYEWRGAGRKKEPVHFRFKDGRLFAFAGIWESWQPPAGGVIESCAILTTEANDLVRPLHDRMPVVIAPERFADWLSSGDLLGLATLLRPWPAEEMLCAPANPYVNDARHEGPACLAPPA
jgi:putative SOS response-associated peptidase YedK